ncbi:unnamed protein product, partial [marine sediment metagenome]
IKQVYLSIQNPKRMNMDDRMFDGPIDKAKIAELTNQGYDGIIVTDSAGGTDFLEIIPFKPTQIKSSIGNTGKFSSTDPSMLAQQIDESTPTKQRGIRVKTPSKYGTLTNPLEHRLKNKTAKTAQADYSRAFNALNKFVDGYVTKYAQDNNLSTQEQIELKEYMNRRALDKLLSRRKFDKTTADYDRKLASLHRDALVKMDGLTKKMMGMAGAIMVAPSVRRKAYRDRSIKHLRRLAKAQSEGKGMGVQSEDKGRIQA